MIQISIKWNLKITPKSVKQGKCLLVATQKRWQHFELLKKSEVTKKKVSEVYFRNFITSVLLLYT